MRGFMKNDVGLKRLLNAVSVSCTLFSILAAYYAGIEKARCVEGFVIGFAMRLVSIFIAAPLANVKGESEKRDKIERFLLKYEHALSLMWILPMIVTLPFFGQPILDGQIIRNTVGIYTYLNYSLIFSGVLTVGFTIYAVIKTARKSK